jgi:hypothetical protein
MPASDFPLNQKIHDEAHDFLEALHEKPDFWKAHSELATECRHSLCLMSGRDFQMLLKKAEDPRWRMDSKKVIDFLANEHHSLDPATQGRTRLLDQRDEYEAQTKKIGLKIWSVGAIAVVSLPAVSILAAHLSMLSPVAGTEQTLFEAGKQFVLSELRSATIGIAMAGMAALAFKDLPEKYWEKASAFRKNYAAPDWSGWKIDRRLLSDAQKNELKDPKRWVELQARFAELPEPQRWISKDFCDSAKMEFLEARTARERRQIIAKNHPSSSAEIGFVLAGKGAHYQPWRPALGTLKSFGALAARAVAPYTPEIVSHSLSSTRKKLNQYKDLDQADIEVLPLNHFSLDAIQKRLIERREALKKVIAANPIKPAMI